MQEDENEIYPFNSHIKYHHKRMKSKDVFKTSYYKENFLTNLVHRVKL